MTEFSAFDSAWAIVKMPMYYHATPTKNLDSILREGIRSKFGEVYASLDPEIARRWISFTQRQSPQVSVIPFWRDEGDPRMTPGADHSPMMLAMLGYDPNEVGEQASFVSSEPIPPQDIWPNAMQNERSPGIMTYDNPLYVEGMAEMMEKVRQMQMEHINSQDEDGEVEKADRDPFGFVDGALQMVGAPYGKGRNYSHEFALFDTEGAKPDKVGHFFVDTVRDNIPTQIKNRLTFASNEDSGAYGSLMSKLRDGRTTGENYAFSHFTDPFTNQPLPILHGDLYRMHQGKGIYGRGVIPTLAQHYGTIGSNRSSRSHPADIAHKKLQIHNHPDAHDVMQQGMSRDDMNQFIDIQGLQDVLNDFDVADFDADRMMNWSDKHETESRGGKMDAYNTKLQGYQIPLTFSCLAHVSQSTLKHIHTVGGIIV